MEIRPVNLRADLSAIADLLELCFEDMDSSGRAAVREMRVLSRSGLLLKLVQNMDRMIKGLMQGYVCVVDGKLVGNVSLYPAGFEDTWVIANVAVHPDYRRQGIAEELCQRALNRIREWKGHAAILQVDAQNSTAQRLYQRLGFFEEGRFTRWRCSSERAPFPLPDMPYITYRAAHEGKAAYALAKLVRPNEHGGLGWLRPTLESNFRPGFWRTLFMWLSSSFQEQWVIRGTEHPIEAMILTETVFGAAYLRFDMLVHPDKKGLLEDSLVNYVLRHASYRYRGVLTEHPSDDTEANEVFKAYQFKIERKQIHMRCNFS